MYRDRSSSLGFGGCGGLGVADDVGEGVGIEGGAADEGAVNLRLAHEFGDVFGLDRSAVEDAGVIRDFCAEAFLEVIANDGVGVVGDLGRGGGAGADGPDGLVGDDEGVGFFLGEVGEGGAHLGHQGVGGVAFLAVGEHFAEAEHGDDVIAAGGLDLEVDVLVGFVSVEASLGVAEKDVGGADGGEHGGRGLAGVGAFAEPVHGLGAGGEAGVDDGVADGGERGGRREEDDVGAGEVVDEGKELADEGDGLGWIFVHLPVGGDDGLAHGGVQYFIDAVWHARRGSSVDPGPRGRGWRLPLPPGRRGILGGKYLE